MSFEFPPGAAIGGIGAYTFSAFRMLAERGCEVEVFSAGPTRGADAGNENGAVHRVPALTRAEFSNAVGPLFAEQHRRRPFDVIECPEIGPEGLCFAKQWSDIPRVTRLHTPSYLAERISYDQPTLRERLRFALGGLRRGRLAILAAPIYRRSEDAEYRCTANSHEVVAPSRAIAEMVSTDWDLERGRVSIVPYPYVPEESLRRLAPPSSVRTVGFLGRLETRKGVVELCQAIPAILREAPDTRFRFIGPSWPYKRADMQSWIEQQLRKHHGSLDFRGAAPHERIAEELAQCDAVVLPSRWENFPYACIESMAAARAVIGSAAGGMAEMIDDRVTGLLVPPRSPGAIVEAVLRLIESPDLARRLAVAGREAIGRLLDPERIFPLQMASYRRAIERASRPMVVA